MARDEDAASAACAARLGQRVGTAQQGQHAGAARAAHGRRRDGVRAQQGQCMGVAGWRANVGRIVHGHGGAAHGQGRDGSIAGAAETMIRGGDNDDVRAAGA